MKKFILILSLSFMSVCTLAQGPSYPEDTVLGLKIDEVPTNLPRCNEEALQSMQTDQRCLFFTNMGPIQLAGLLIPKEETNLPFPLSRVLYYANTELLLVLPDSIEPDTVINYLVSEYGDTYEHIISERPGEYSHITEEYIFISGNIKICFRYTPPESKFTSPGLNNYISYVYI